MEGSTIPTIHFNRIPCALKIGNGFENHYFVRIGIPVINLRILHLPLLGIHSRARLVPGRGRADPRLRLGHLEWKVLEMEVPQPGHRPFGARSTQNGGADTKKDESGE